MMNLSRPAGLIDALLCCHIFSSFKKKQQATMADLADLGAGGTQEYPNYADDEGKNICLAYFVCIWRRPIHFACRFVGMITLHNCERTAVAGFFEF